MSAGGAMLADRAAPARDISPKERLDEAVFFAAPQWPRFSPAAAGSPRRQFGRHAQWAWVIGETLDQHHGAELGVNQPIFCNLQVTLG